MVAQATRRLTALPRRTPSIRSVNRPPPMFAPSRGAGSWVTRKKTSAWIWQRPVPTTRKPPHRWPQDRDAGVRPRARGGAGAADLGRPFADDRRPNRLLTPPGLPHEGVERALEQLAERKTMRGGDRRELLLHAELHVPAGAVSPHRLRRNTAIMRKAAHCGCNDRELAVLNTGRLVLRLIGHRSSLFRLAAPHQPGR